MNRERDYTLDLIRVIAAFSVVSVHFFLNIGFYTQIVIGERMYVMVISRTFFMICVPLFVILTGYLMGAKKLSKQYYQGITKTLCIYVLASIACIIYKNQAGITSYNLKQAFLAILDFSGANYSWYVEMYIGLFLLIPFLNLIFSNLDQKKRKLLIVTLMFLTSIPTFTNIYDFGTAEQEQQILPYYWADLWPLTYYFIGCYLREHPLKINWKTASFLAVLVTLVSGSYSFYRSYNTNFVLGIRDSWGNLLNVLLAIFVFYCLLQLKCINKMPEGPKSFIKKLSDFTLGAYLVSYIFDQVFYKVLNNRVPEVFFRMRYYIVIVPLVFICSMLLSSLLNLVYYLICRITGQIRSLYNRQQT